MDEKELVTSLPWLPSSCYHGFLPSFPDWELLGPITRMTRHHGEGKGRDLRVLPLPVVMLCHDYVLIPPGKKNHRLEIHGIVMRLDAEALALRRVRIDIGNIIHRNPLFAMAKPKHSLQS